MFKKFKDAIGKDLKQVQQFAQSISPTASVKSDSTPAVLSDDLTASSSMFSISDDMENGSIIDLTANSPSILPTRSRRDSLSSVASDASSLFPIYEGSFNHNQSEWESELDESTLEQLETINKAQLYQAYNVLTNKYKKYKTRFLDVAKSNRELQKENLKTKNVLQDCQDKSLKRINELRELCQLEQKAKAHLEECLRNDLEEKDNIITTLKTKIGFLSKDDSLVEIEDSQTKNNELVAEIERLKGIIEQPAAGTNHVKEAITQLKSGIVLMKSENENISNLLSTDKNRPLIDFNESDNYSEQILLLTKEKDEKQATVLELTKKLEDAYTQITNTNQTVEILKNNYEELKKREEKLINELKNNQDYIQKIEIDLEESRKIEMEIKSTAKSKLASYEAEILKFKDAVAKATDIRDDALKKLIDKENCVKMAEVNAIDLENEKKRLNDNVQVFLNSHQEKLTQVFEKLENKLVKAEGNIVRLCADKLINVRSAEMELRENVKILEREIENSRNDKVRIENLERNLQSLEITLRDKDKAVNDLTKSLNALNLELNEKIDRIVELGTELEESSAKNQLLIESTDTKNEQFAKYKTDTDDKVMKCEERILQLQTQIKSTVEENIAIKTENRELLEKVHKLEASIEEDKEKLKYFEIEQKTALEISETLSQKNSQITELQNLRDQLENNLKLKQEEINQLKNNHSSELAKLSQEKEELKSIADNQKTSFQNLSDNYETCKKELADLKNSIDDEKTKLMEECESKVNILKNEIKFLNEKFENEVGNMETNSERECSELREKLTHSENMATELLNKLEDSSAKREEMTLLCQERTLKVGELESCLAELKSDLDRNFNQTSKISNTQFEEMYETRLKEIVTDFEKQLADREEVRKMLEIQLAEHTDALESIPALRTELKNLRAELKEKDNLLETKIEELENLRKESENKILNAKIDNDELLQAQVEKYENLLKKQKSEFDSLRIDDDKTETELKVVQLENRLQKTVEEKKINDLDDTADLPEDLENTSKIAVAAVASSNESLELLRKEMMNQAEEIKELKKRHKREVLELRKWIHVKSMDKREDADVEHEYLRNILYEYMMGREQHVLAKVLAAIVKFDQQQLHNILEKLQTVHSFSLL